LEGNHVPVEQSLTLKTDRNQIPESYGLLSLVRFACPAKHTLFRGETALPSFLIVPAGPSGNRVSARLYCCRRIVIDRSLV